ncbi:MAG: dTDP-4-dehydrorhamnose reductase [Hyphomicrobium sp.]
MRLLIAGGQGQVATALVDVAPSRREITAFAVGRPALDICEVRTIERAFGEIRPNVVINTAAYTNVDKAESEPERAMALNRDGARLLAAAAAKGGVPIVHLSTDYVFDGAAAKPYAESDPTGPATVYGRTKLEGELAVQEANPRHVILRTAWVYSPFGKNFVKTVLQRARDGNALRIVADQRGSPTYAPHLVDAIITIAARVAHIGDDQSDVWGVYHAAGAGSASWCDVARAIVDNADDLRARGATVDAITSTEYPTPAKRPANSELDCAKLARTFNLRLPAWRNGVAECVRRLSPP